MSDPTPDGGEELAVDKRHLVAAMVGAIPGRAAKVAYMDEAEFHAIVEVVADLWIALGPTLVQQAIERRAEMQRQVEALMRSPLPGSKEGST